MAVVAVEGAELLEGAEVSEESEAAFTQDSKSNAASKNVDVEGLAKLIQGPLSLALAITDIARSEKRGAQETANRRDDRYRTGIVYDTESRIDLTNEGRIPSYFSRSNIIGLLARNVLPYGWNVETAVEQGFGSEIRAGEFRKQSEEQSGRIIDRLRKEREVRQSIEGANNLRKKLRLNRHLEALKTNIL